MYEKERIVLKEFMAMIRIFIVLLIIIWIIFAFVIGIKMVPNDDMAPRMNAGDIMLYYRIVPGIQNQDVVVIKKNDTEYVGRVIAKGHDKVEITEEGNLIVNDNMIAEDKIFYSTPPYEGFVEYPVTLAADEYFILCDYRDGGEDSRYYGPVKESEIKGILIGLYRRSGF